MKTKIKILATLIVSVILLTNTNYTFATEKRIRPGFIVTRGSEPLLIRGEVEQKGLLLELREVEHMDIDNEKYSINKYGILAMKYTHCISLQNQSNTPITIIVTGLEFKENYKDINDSRSIGYFVIGVGEVYEIKYPMNGFVTYSQHISTTTEIKMEIENRQRMLKKIKAEDENKDEHKKGYSSVKKLSNKDYIKSLNKKAYNKFLTTQFGDYEDLGILYKFKNNIYTLSYLFKNQDESVNLRRIYNKYSFNSYVKSNEYIKIENDNTKLEIATYCIDDFKHLKGNKLAPYKIDDKEYIIFENKVKKLKEKLKKIYPDSIKHYQDGTVAKYDLKIEKRKDKYQQLLEVKLSWNEIKKKYSKGIPLYKYIEQGTSYDSTLINLPNNKNIFVIQGSKIIKRLEPNSSYMVPKYSRAEYLSLQLEENYEALKKTRTCIFITVQ